MGQIKKLFAKPLWFKSYFPVTNVNIAGHKICCTFLPPRLVSYDSRERERGLFPSDGVITKQVSTKVHWYNKEGHK